jgi:hypothetical protein
MDLAALITDPLQMARALSGMASMLPHDPDSWEQAASLQRGGCEAAARVEDTDQRAALLRELLLSERPSAEQESVRCAACALARSFDARTQRAIALSDVAIWLHASGRTPDALRVSDEIKSLLLLPNTDDDVHDLVRTQCLLMANLGNLEGALAFAADLYPVELAQVFMLLGRRAQRDFRRAQAGANCCHE